MRELVANFTLLLPPARRLEATLLLGSILAFAAIEVAWVASIFWLMNAAVDVIAQPQALENYRILLALQRAVGVADSRSLLQVAAVLVIIIIMLRNAWGALVVWQRARFVKYLEAETATRLLRAYVVQPYPFFLDKNSAALSKNVLSEVSALISVSILSAINIIIDGVTSFALIGYLVVENPVVTLAAIGCLGAVLAVIYYGVRLRLASMGSESRRAEEGIFRKAQEVLAGIKDVKVLGRERYFVDAFAGFARAKARLHVESAVIKETPRYLVEALAFIGLIAAMAVLIGSSARVAEVTGVLVLYGVAGFRLMPALFRIYNGVSSFQFAHEVFHSTCRDIAGERPGQGLPLDPPPLSLDREIRFHSVGFCYPGAAGLSVSALDLVIKANTSVALVGPTGAGKTTIADLAMGLLIPTEGRIEVDGAPIRGDAIRAWRGDIGYVPQHIFLSDDTVLRNIAFGRDDAEVDRAAAVEAGKAAHIHDFVESLPQGYDTIVGERGLRLSGGQRQRLGIARALYRRPKVLIMDEATSALDGITENIVSEAIGDLSGKITMIIIAHRLTTVRHCDVIHLLEHGHVSASGSFDDLMSANATFRAMAGGRQGQ